MVDDRRVIEPLRRHHGGAGGSGETGCLAALVDPG